MSTEVFKLEGKIAIDNTSAEKAIDSTANKANQAHNKIADAFRKIGQAAIDSFNQAESGSGRSLAEIAKDSGKTVNQLKSDVMKAAKGYKDNGMTMSEAMKKAYADIGYASKSTSKQVAEDAEEASEEIAEHAKDAEKKVKNSSGGIGKAFDKMFSGIGKAASVCGKAVVTGLAAGATAMGALIAKSMGLAGELEQNMGGSEAVFKHHAQRMQNEAAEAFKTMGLSQSEYLQSANKMGALFQGMGYSTADSVDMTINAMQRAADVASIMGISQEEAMEAVNGMAKGNFTMMDNLGVAMNDTALAAFAVEKGITKSVQSMSTNEKIGLAYQMFMEKSAYAAGNYAKENDTLAGSLSTAKAAWENFLSGSDTVYAPKAMADMVDAFVNVGEVIIKNMNKLLPKLTKGLTTLVERLTPYIPEMLQAVLPGLIEGAVALITGLALALPDILEIIVAELPYLMEQLASAAEKVFPVLQQSFMDLFESIDWVALGAGIGDLINRLPELLSNVGNVISYLWQTAVWPMIRGLFKQFGIDLPDWETLKTQFETWWNGLVGSANELTKAVFGLSFSDMDETGETWLSRIGGWFDNILLALGGMLCALFGLELSDKDRESGKTWWDVIALWFGNILYHLGSGLLALFGIDIPPWDEVKGDIEKWWKDVTKDLNLEAFFRLIGTVFEIKPAGGDLYDENGNVDLSNNVGLGMTDEEYINAINNPNYDWSQHWGDVDGSHATGLDFVPRDNYLARLHYGEGILTKEENDARRNGQQSGIDYDRLAEAMAQRPMAFNIDGKAFAVMLARELSRTIGNRNIQSLMAMGG